MEKKHTLGNKVISGITWSYAERFSAQIVSLIVSVVLARILDPAHYGILAIVTVFTAIGDALVTDGFGNALVQKKDADSVDFNSICWLSVGIAAGLYGVLFVCAPLIARFYEMEQLTLVTRVMGIRLLFSAFNSVQQAYVQKHLLFKKYFFASLTGAAVSAFVGIGLALSGAGVWALVAQNLSLTVVSTGVLMLISGWRPGLRCSAESIRSMWSYGSKIILSTITYTLKDNIRSLVVGKCFTSEDLAFYNQGKKYPALLVTDVVQSMGKVLFPVLSDRQGHNEENKRLMRTSVRLSSFVLLPLIFGLIAISDTFVVCLMTEKWLPAVPYMRILCLVYITRPMSTVFQKALLAIGKSDINLKHEIYTSALTLGLIVLAVAGLKSVALIAWSYVIVALVGTGYFAAAVKKHYRYGIREILQDYLPALLLSCLMCGCAFAVGRIDMHIILKLIVQVGAGIAVYVLGAMAFRMEAFAYIWQFVLSAVKKKRNA